MARLFQKRKNIQLPKTAVGDNTLPTESEIEKMNSQADKKTKEYEKDNPKKPKSVSKTTSAPLIIREKKTSKRDEALSIVKKILGKHSEMDVTYDELVASVIRLYSDNMEFLKKINVLQGKLTRAKVYSSAQFSPSWN